MGRLFVKNKPSNYSRIYWKYKSEICWIYAYSINRQKFIKSTQLFSTLVHWASVQNLILERLVLNFFLLKMVWRLYISLWSLSNCKNFIEAGLNKCSKQIFFKCKWTFHNSTRLINLVAKMILMKTILLQCIFLNWKDWCR